jgi:hypothetical protein
MATMPPRGTLGGPPPGSTPQGLSRIPSGGGPPEAAPAAGGQGKGLAKLFFQVEQSLDAIAGVIPTGSEKIDMIKTQLREVLAEALSGGAAFTGNPNSPRGTGQREDQVV